MSDDKPLRLRGRCYTTGRDFVAQLEVQEGNRKVMKTLSGDPHLQALLEEAFNFLVSDVEERYIAGYMTKKGYTNEGIPYVVVSAAGHKYGLIRAKKQPNSAQLWLSLPFVGSHVTGLVADEIGEDEYDYDMAEAGDTGEYNA